MVQLKNARLSSGRTTAVSMARKVVLTTVLVAGCSGNSEDTQSEVSTTSTSTANTSTSSTTSTTTTATTGTTSTTPARNAALDAYLSAQVKNLGVPGIAAAIIKDGEIKWSGGYGMANFDLGLEMTVDTPVMLASISKTVMVTAFMQVWEQQPIDLYEDISATLPFAVSNPTHPDIVITPHQLLSHTSSIKDNWSVLNDHYFDGDAPITLEEYLEDYFTEGSALYDADRNFYSEEPSEAYHYSNIGSATAALLIEHYTKSDFADWCNQHIFDPLGMSNTGWFLSDFDEDLVAMPYLYHPKKDEWISYGHYGYPDYPDGQLRASVNDLALFLATMSQGGVYQGVRVLEEKSVEMVLSPSVPKVEETQGLIWYWYDWLGSTWYGHSGADWGINTEMMFRKEDGLGIVLLVNGGISNMNLFYQTEARLIAEAEKY